jgi:hypothetical protein
MKLWQHTNVYWIARLRLLTAVLMLGQCVLSGCESRKDSESHSENANGGLHFRLETDFSRSEYLLGETVTVRKYLRNTTDKDIVICLWPSKAEQVFTHYEDNKPVVYKDTVLFYKPVSKDESFIHIKPMSEVYYGSSELGEEFQEEFPSQYFDKIGRWELTIIHSYDFTGERFHLDGWHGKVSSNVLSISIVPPKKTGKRRKANLL